jgi:hypothetical protein
LAAFVCATGSAGTIAAGDHLKAALGARIAAVEAVECPTLIMNGFGEHNIQGIGDKHVPLIHNVMNTDVAIGVSDHATDTLLTLFNTDAGKQYLVERRGVDPSFLAALQNFGISSICNIVAAVKLAKYFDLGPDDVVLTVATDGSEMYMSEVRKALPSYFGNRFDAVAAGETWGQHMAGASVDHVLELNRVDRKRVFNLGYFTWVEQQGVSLEDFLARAKSSFWDGLLELAPAWDAMIEKFNAESGAAARLA